MNQRPGTTTPRYMGVKMATVATTAPPQPADQIADEGGGDHDEAGGDEPHGHRVEELTRRQPAVLLHDAFAQEGNNGKAAPEYERPGFEEEQEKGQVGLRPGTREQERLSQRR